MRGLKSKTFFKASVITGISILAFVLAGIFAAWRIRLNDRHLAAESERRAAEAKDFDKEVARLDAEAKRRKDDYQREVLEAETIARQKAEKDLAQRSKQYLPENVNPPTTVSTRAQREQALYRSIDAIYNDRSKSYAVQKAEVESLKAQHEQMELLYRAQEDYDEAMRRYQRALHQ